MKILKTLFLLFLITASGLIYAQTDKYTAVMQKGMTLLDSAKNTEDLLAVSNHFERIAGVETKQWLPTYYEAYANLRSGFLTNDNDKKDVFFDKALVQIDKSEAISANNSEIYALKGYIQFMKMSVDPQNRAMEMIGIATTSLEKAKALDPSNPRPYFILGQAAFYTPEAFGGGKEKAKPILETAITNFEKFKSADPFAPKWGKERCQMLLDQCK